MRTLRMFAVVLSVAGSSSLANAATYDIDAAHSTVQFAIRHMMISNVKGEFGKIAGVLVYDEKNPSNSSVEATIDVTAINTRDASRDKHLKSADFFDVAKYPTLTFKSTKVETLEPGKLRVTGNLTMHGVTKEVALDVDGPTGEVKDPAKHVRIGASASTTLRRKDFGIDWNVPVPTGGVLVGETVAVSLEMEFVKKDSELAGK